MADLKNIPARLKLAVARARAERPAVDVAIQTFKTYSVDDGGSYAAALTYYMFFSIFPLLLFSASILGFVTRGNVELQTRVLEAGIESVPFLQEILHPDNLSSIQERAGGLALTGAFLALYTGSGAIVALEHALNRIYGVTDEPKWVEKRLRSLKFLMVFGLAAIASFALGGVAGFAADLFPSGAGATAVAWTASHVLGFILGTGIFAAAYRLLPAVTRSWRDVLPGALIAAFLFEVLKELGSIYLERGAENREATFGAFALAAGLLIGSYLIAQITLLAAELNDVLVARRITRQTYSHEPKEAPDGTDRT